MLPRPPLTEMAAYHAQQAAEKALKAVLTAHDTPFRLTHNLVELHEQCAAVVGGMAPFAPRAQVLTPYATQFRYPCGPLEPSGADANVAQRLAEEIVAAARAHLIKCGERPDPPSTT